MRPGQNKRMRGRPTNNRRGPNPLTRSYESNGPDVKIRGNAHHVAEKYLQLARDAHTGGDPVAAENYLQHAEHYFRLIAAAQAAQALAQSGQPRGEGEADETEDDDDFGGLSDRFASPSERAPPQYAQQPQQSFAPPQPSGTPQLYQERQPYDGERPNQPDRGGFPGNRQDRQSGPRFQERGPRPDRPFGERPEGQRDNRPPRDGRPRDFRPYRDQPPQPREAGGEAGAAATGLPSFITAAPRLSGPSEAGESQPPAAGEPFTPTAPSPDVQPPFLETQQPEARFPGRGRRRRLRSPYGFNAGRETDLDESLPPPPARDEPPVSE
jgi:hypothetical protein